MPIFQTVAIVGVGLIGGSIGLALRQRKLAAEVIGIGRRQASLDMALSLGALDRAELDLEKGVAAADVVVVSTPVASVADNVCRVMTAATGRVLVTDAGSTKALICAEVEARAASPVERFVGSHPLAGDHRSGPENARADLLDGKTVVVTPTEATPEATVDRAQAFWELFGAHVVRLPPDQHDRALASTSHLPHLVASALAAATPQQCLPLAATGWADTTRIAAADPALWTQIFSQNQIALMGTLDGLVEQLEQLRENLAAENWAQIQETLEKAKRMRDALGD